MLWLIFYLSIYAIAFPTSVPKKYITLAVDAIKNAIIDTFKK